MTFSNLSGDWQRVTMSRQHHLRAWPWSTVRSQQQEARVSTTALAAAAPRRPALRTPPWWRDAATFAAVGSLGVVVVLWIAGRGLQDLAGTQTVLSSLGRLAGLVGSDLLLLQVLLLARLPLVERAFGQDELVRRHRLVGLWSFTLVVAHVVLITLGYAVAAHDGPLHQLVSLVLDSPGMLLAAAGTLALVLVVVTSIRAARARLRYESWHLLHLYAYLGVGLALPHQLWTGRDLLDRPLATAYWWSAWGATAASVVVYRVGLPAWRSWRHRLVVERVVQEGPGVVSVHLTGRDLHRLPVRAGQFFTWRFLSGPGWTAGHPYSLSAPPHGGGLRITARSPDLERLRPGTRVLVEGPYGRLTADARTRRKLTVLASGIGVTPGLALLHETDYAAGEAVLIHRVSTDRDRLFETELDELAAARGVRVVPVVGSRIPGRSSWLPCEAAHLTDPEALLLLVPDLPEHDVFVCGPTEWVDAAMTACRSAGVPAAQLHVEHFSW